MTPTRASSAHAQEAAEQSLIEEAAFIRRQETDRASPAQAPTVEPATGGAGALEVLAAICEVDTRYMHSKMTDADYVLLLSPHIEDARKVLALAAGIPAAPAVAASPKEEK